MGIFDAFGKVVKKLKDPKAQRDYHRRYMRQRYQKDPKHRNKQRARAALGNAVEHGSVEKKPCKVCGKPAEAHHPDYKDPLKVEWLCREHHGDGKHGGQGFRGKCLEATNSSACVECASELVDFEMADGRQLCMGCRDIL